MMMIACRSRGVLALRINRAVDPTPKSVEQLYHRTTNSNPVLPPASPTHLVERCSNIPIFKNNIKLHILPPCVYMLDKGKHMSYPVHYTKGHTMDVDC